MTYTVLNLPIEPIERRYSIQWDRWFREAFVRNDIPYKTITGPSDLPQPASDKFLDPEATFRWKYSQLIQCLEACKDHSRRYVIFLHDGWTPGIEMFPYLRDIGGLDVRVCGWWHAGSYDPTDLLGLKGCWEWAWGSECSWLSIHDVIFVGSEYHARKLCSNRIIPRRKVRVLGNPVEVSPQWRLDKREQIVVWPHRLSGDKHPEVFERLASEPRFQGVRFVRTMDENLSKEDYCKRLGSAEVAVSTATHENFGIAMVEAAMMGCHPVCPRGLAYLETMEDSCLYTTYEDLVDKVDEALHRDRVYVYPHAERYKPDLITDKVCAVIRSLGEGHHGD